MLLLTAYRRRRSRTGAPPGGVLARAEGGGEFEELLGLEKLSTGDLSFLYLF